MSQKNGDIPVALTFDDVLLLPAASKVLPNEVDVRTRLSRNITMNIPLLSAAMDTVTEANTAISMAREGGIGIIHRNMSVERQAREADKVKKSESGMIVDPVTMHPQQKISEVLEVMERYRISGVPIVEDGRKLVGIVTNRDLRFETNLEQKVADVMTRDNLVTASEGITLEESKVLLHQNRIEKLLVVNDLFLTATAKLAHYVFPAASFLERSELHYHPKYHLVTLTRKIAEIPGVYDEYSLWRDLAHRLGIGDQYFPWKNEAEVNQWILEPTGISLEELQKHPEGIVYKPLRHKKYETQPFPTPSGKIEFTSSYLKSYGLSEIPEYIPPSYLSHRKEEYPFVLTTGARKSLYCHTRYYNIPKFQKADPGAEVEIHPSDADRLGIEGKERLRVISEIGAVEVQAKIVDPTQIMPGILEIVHGRQDGNVNLVTSDYLNDPISGFPVLKGFPVRIEKISS